MSELFDARVRYSGASLGAQLASVFAGGLAPFIGTGLLQAGYMAAAVTLYVVGLAVVTILAVVAATETTAPRWTRTERSPFPVPASRFVFSFGSEF